MPKNNFINFPAFELNALKCIIECYGSFGPILCSLTCIKLKKDECGFLFVCKAEAQ